MNPSSLYALISALVYGVGDFSAGLASRHNPAIRVVALTHPLGLLAYTALALFTHEALPLAPQLWLAALTGVIGMVAVVLFFRALALGPMGVVSVSSAAVGAVVPVVAGLIAGETLTGGRLLGMALILTGIVVFSLAPSHGGRGGLPLAVIAGLGFGLFFVLLAKSSVGAVFWPLAVARLASSLVALPLAARQGGLRPQAPWLILGSVPGDVLGNLFFTLAARTGPLAVAGLLTNLYPVFTALMAAVFLRERLRRYQWLGAGVILAGLPFTH
ncbi:DMT family transporter [Deinococcus altitudinis]|uniref:DMT family transporter n=1 Tax=Deinococcus altitudinis TaxID=468914 RepID=UPI0038914710